ncbi:ABC transporter substrate-binding protein [Roseomonas populi]|uniref:ABC transporter substrate-binding protein n=1 Tax=Roseomonas populi TaxID=3121582 RepID=A0ABT1X673_9PROT|nr:ABC transporter substrate-binding protein [Roseomonas pecuniae]MCR0983594.1 ABC transporter substrate-binding protein [Roseomonas pecuniae]
MLGRRDALKLALAGAATAYAPAVHAQAAARTLKFVPHSNLFSVDPIWTPAAVVRNHGYMVFDTLYGMDANYKPQPQMAEGHVLEDGGRTVTITLRPGLTFHDGEPVRAADAVASIRRWARRAAIGGKLMDFTDELSALDDRRIRFRLKEPFPLLPHALGHVGAPIPFIMPERLARTDAFQQVREVVGSGPFRFKADEMNPGSFFAYERFAGYKPTPTGTPSLVAGPKQVWFDRVEWTVIPDASTGAAAIQSGEQDWLEAPEPDLERMLARSNALRIEPLELIMRPAYLRLNHPHPPFNNVKVRQALLAAVDQASFMSAVIGPDPQRYVSDAGIVTPGSPYATRVGLEPILAPRSTDRAKALLKEGGYNNEPARLLVAMDVGAQAALGQVAGELFRGIGLNLDFVSTDWGSILQRTTNREPLEKGGWSSYATFFPGLDLFDPGANAVLRGNGLAGANGWPTSAKLEALRDEWFRAPDEEARKAVAGRMQTVALEEVLFVPLGAFRSNTVMKRNLEGRVPGMPLFWNMKRA